VTKLNMFIPITKIDAVNRLVYGVATAETPDRTGEICDYESTVPYYKAWSEEIAKASDGKSLGNLRAMHGKIAAGKLTEINFDDVNKRISICAKVVDDGEWEKVQEGVYTGFSQGGSYAKRWPDANNPNLKRYTAAPSEISLVDLPCLPTATFEVVKGVGSGIEEKMTKTFKTVAEEPEVQKAYEAFVKGADPASGENKDGGDGDGEGEAGTQQAATSDPEQVWKAKDGKTFSKKAEAVAHNRKIEAEAEVAKLTGKVDTVVSDVEKAMAPETKETKETAEDTSEGEKKGKKDKKKGVRKSFDPKELSKYITDCGRLACMIRDLVWLKSDLEYEKVVEGDSSPMVDECQKMIDGLCMFLRKLVAEETAEVMSGTEMMMVAKAVTYQDLEAKATLEAIEGIHKDFIAAFAEVQKRKDAEPPPVEKGMTLLEELKKVTGGHLTVDNPDLPEPIAKVLAKNEALEGVLTKVVTQVEELGKKVTAFLAQPEPAKGQLRGVHKVQDNGGPALMSDDEFNKKFTAMSPEDQARLLMKASLRQGVAIAG